MHDLLEPRAAAASPMTPLPGLDLLSTALRSVGSADFYPALVAWVGSAIPNDIWFVTQYSRTHTPVILHDNWGRSDAMAYYMGSVHKYDPTYHVLGDETLMCGTSMANIADRFSLDRRYADYLDNIALIRDELMIVLPQPDERYIAIGLDRSTVRFTADEIHLARALSSVLAEMQRLHVERCGGAGERPTQPPAAERDGIDRLAGSSDETLAAALGHFARSQGLTPREAQITALCLRGYPNAAIARALSISHGVVKNHKFRLYRKLDITTERELFALFLETTRDLAPGALAGSR